MNILEFALRLGLELSPVQTVVLKCLYGIPLDDRVVFPLVNPQGMVAFVSEQQYLKNLHLEGRSNIETVTAPSRLAILSLGRRSGKSILSSLVAVFETYCKIREGVEGPRGLKHVRVYGLNRDSQVAEAKIIADYIKRDAVLMKHLKGLGNRDSWTFQDAHQTPVVQTSECVARATDVCGFGHGTTMILSEMAYFREDFIWEETWGLYDKTIAFSSPKWGSAFHRLYRHKDTDLALSIPTWEMNPSVPLDVYHDALGKDLDTFRSELGAEFVAPKKASCCPHCGK
jgi:hypothetical protein